MHTHHYIGVEAGTVREALAAASDCLAKYEGKVWDWYQIGGRWSGFLDGKDSLRYVDNPDLWEKTLGGCFKSRDALLVDLLEELQGKEALPIGDEPWQKKMATARTGHREEIAKEFQQLLLAKKAPREFPDPRVYETCWRLSKIADMFTDVYTEDSRFLDGVEHSIYRGYIDKRCKDSPETQWLVSVDLHY